MDYFVPLEANMVAPSGGSTLPHQPMKVLAMLEIYVPLPVKPICKKAYLAIHLGKTSNFDSIISAVWAWGALEGQEEIG